MPNIYIHATLAIALASILAITPTLATAANPHFIGGQPKLTCNTAGCTLEPFSIAGLGNNAVVRTTITVEGTCDVTCTNPAGNIAPGQDTFGTTTTNFEPVPCDENGRCNVGQQTAPFNPPSTAQLREQNLCPNKKWTPAVVPGTCTATGGTATITADGFGPIVIEST